MTPPSDIESAAKAACRRLLGEVDRDPLSPTRGCFDRRYWAWKLADMPEATLQRNVFALGWWRDRLDPREGVSRDLLTDTLLAGLRYAAAIQHADGSFDQAFPNEHSFGATAFLLFDLGRAAGQVSDDAQDRDRIAADDLCRRAAGFLCTHDERHGFIANHMAGAAAALTLVADKGEPRAQARADQLLERVLASQSVEGWFPEYGGADPGYQSLCLYYLAWIYRRRPDSRLRDALGRAVEFLSWFAHPGGSFGGEYGSRRTALLHAGGFALLRAEYPQADAMARFAERAIVAGRAPTLADIDSGNVAPLFMSYAALADHPAALGSSPALLPFELPHAARSFSGAGLAVQSTDRYFAVLGASNGGVLKIFRQPDGACIGDDGGYAAVLADGRIATTQVPHGRATWSLDGAHADVRTPFCLLQRELPTPWRFVLVRLFGLVIAWLPPVLQTFCREWFKRALVTRLIAGSRTVPIVLERRVAFMADAVKVDDVVRATRPLRVTRLERGAPFVGIHMASARYYPGFADAWPPPGRAALDALPLESAGEVRSGMVVR